MYASLGESGGVEEELLHVSERHMLARRHSNLPNVSCSSY